MSEEKKGLLDHAIAAATTLDVPSKSNVMKEWQTSKLPVEMVQVDISLPKRFDAEGFPVARKQLEKEVEDYIKAQTLIMLTGSCFIGTGNEPAPGAAFSMPFLEERLRTDFGTKVVRTKEGFSVTGQFGNGSKRTEFTLHDTDKHLCALRAVHLMFTHNDPDLREYIVRMTNEDIRKMAAEDAAATPATAPENTQAPVTH